MAKNNNSSQNWRLEGDCKGLAAWHIEKGHFTNGIKDGGNRNNNDNDNNSINLANLNIILAVHAPGHMFTGPKWKIALYLDEKANNDQKDALTKIFTSQAGGEFFIEILPRIGEILGIRSVSIEFNIEGKKKHKI